MSQNTSKDTGASRTHLIPLLRWVFFVSFAATLLTLGMGWLARGLHIPSLVAAPAVEIAAADGSALSGYFQAMSLNGSLLGPENFSGKPVVVDFWATWCAPCRLQAKYLEELHAELGDEVAFLAVSLGEEEKTVRGYVERSPFSYPVLYDPDDAITSRYEIYSLPTVMIVDEEGRVIFKQPGISDVRTLKNALGKAI